MRKGQLIWQLVVLSLLSIEISAAITGSAGDSSVGNPADLSRLIPYGDIIKNNTWVIITIACVIAAFSLIIGVLSFLFGPGIFRDKIRFLRSKVTDRGEINQIHVETSNHLEGQTGKIPESLQLNIFAANNGENSVTLAQIGYEDIKSGKKTFLDQRSFHLPHLLGPGTTYSLWIDYKDLPTSPVYFFLKDGRGRIFKSTVPYPPPSG